MQEWRLLDHDADVGILGRGRSVAEAFEQVALGMTAIVTDAEVHPDQCVLISCAAPDMELLLVDWLNALIFEMATRGMLFGRFIVSIEDHTLNAQAWGEDVDRQRHKPAVEIKGATLTDIRVKEDEPGNWYARCVVDV